MSLAPQERLDKRADRATLDPVEREAPLERLETLDLLDPLAQRVSQEPQAPRAPRETLAPWVCPEL